MTPAFWAAAVRSSIISGEEKILHRPAAGCLVCRRLGHRSSWRDLGGLFSWCCGCLVSTIHIQARSRQCMISPKKKSKGKPVHIAVPDVGVPQVARKLCLSLHLGNEMNGNDW